MNKTILYTILLLSMVGVSYAAYDTTNLTAYYSYDTSSISGSNLQDIYTSIHNGTFNGSVNSQVTGKIAQATNFSGSAGVPIPLSFSGFNFTTGPTNFSVAFWYNSKAASLMSLFTETESVSGNGWLIEQQANGSIDIRVDNVQVGHTSALNDGSWHFICAVKNGSTATVYWDGNTGKSGSVDASMATTNVNLLRFGNVWTGPINTFNGAIDEAGLWGNRTLTQSDCAAGYNSGTGLNPVTPATSNFTINPYDLYNSNGLSVPLNITITYNGSSWTYTNQVGNFSTNITNAAGQGLYANISITSYTYFNYSTTNYNTSSQLNAGMYAGIQIYNVSEVVTGQNITNFTIKADNGQYYNSSNDIVTVYLPYISSSLGTAYTFNYTFNKTSYFNTSLTKNIFLGSSSYPFNGSLKQLTGNPYKYAFNLTFNNSITGVNATSFAANITSGLYSYNTTVSTTNGTIIVPWTNDTNINITLYNSSTISTNSTLWNTSNYTSVPVLINISLSSVTTNSYSFYIYNEVNGSLITNANVTLYLTSSSTSYNFTTGNGTYFASLLSPLLYQLTAIATGYSTRTYYIVVTNQTTNTKNIYLLPDGYGTVQVTVYDQSYTSLPNYFVSITKKNLSGTTYYETERCKADANGQCLVSMQLCSATNSSCPYYRAIVYDPTETTIEQDTGDLKIKAETPMLSIVVSGNDIVSGIINYYGTTQYVGPFDNTTGVVNYYFDNSLGLASSINLVVQRKVGNTWTTLSSQTTSGSGQLIITSSGTNLSLGDEFTATGYWTDASGVTHIGAQKAIIPSSSGIGSSKTSVVSFAGLGIALAPLVFMGAVGPIIAPIISVALMFMTNIIGISTFTTNVIGAIVIIVAVTLWVML